MSEPRWIVHQGDCLAVLRTLPDNSIDAIVTDPPYGLEFMGLEFDTFRGDAWRTGAGMSKPGIGPRRTEWPAFGGGDGANATCATFGGRQRGKKRCQCAEPVWQVKGKPQGDRNARTESMRAFQAWCESWAVEALRVAKPGAHIIAFGGTRTYHRLTCALEEAGWEIRDSLACWLQGQGFPKSLDVSKALDKAAGAEREVIGTRIITGNAAQTTKEKGGTYASCTDSRGVPPKEIPITAPATEAAKEHVGKGTALKPSFEPIVLARKPLEGTVAENVLKHGTGAMNIDACRVQTSTNEPDSGAMYYKNRGLPMPGNHQNYFGQEDRTVACDPIPGGRWPPNTVLVHGVGCRQVGTRKVKTSGQTSGPTRTGESSSVARGTYKGTDSPPPFYSDEDGMETIPEYECEPGCPVKALDDQSGIQKDGYATSRKGANGYGGGWGPQDYPEGGVGYGGEGGASRFFPQFGFDQDDLVPFLYCPKASSAERDEGLTGDKGLADPYAQHRGRRMEDQSRFDGKPPKEARNTHPTVKPISLIRWLVRLSCPEGGTVLDLFNGSGTTGCACMYEGYVYIGIERDPTFVSISRNRITYHELKSRGGVPNPFTMDTPVEEPVAEECPKVESLEDLFGFGVK